MVKNKTISQGLFNALVFLQVRGISQVISNTDLPYVPSNVNNDYVILKVDPPLIMGGNVQAACLPSANYLPDTASESKCFTSGWGSVSEYQGTTAKYLRYMRAPVIPNNQCEWSLTDAMLCAGYTDKHKHVCSGDSGGPLVCNNNGDAVIAGVVSYGKRCIIGRPDVYARVTTVLNWIENNMVIFH